MKKKREKFALVLLLQLTPVSCTKQGKSVLVLFIQFVPVNCEKTNKQRFLLVIFIEFTPINCEKKKSNSFIQFSLVCKEFCVLSRKRNVRAFITLLAINSVYICPLSTVYTCKL